MNIALIPTVMYLSLVVNYIKLTLCFQIDTEEITVENALAKMFDRAIRTQLDPVWHQLGAKTRQLVSDLKTLRLILK